MENKQLQRASFKENKMLAGVCYGLAEYLNLDKNLMRILFIVSGVGILGYIVLALMIPEAEEF